MTGPMNLKKFCNKLKNNSFSIQVKESTYFSNKCHSIAFVIFVDDSELQKNSSPAKSCLKQAMAKIYSTLHLPTW